ncbi:radical SAM protein [Parvimonas parva]|uniref:Radical SAM protein n=1 Tax=Parvimonas parva TaxID=2769485 RepID=A0ABS1CA21_9FIRM|nr:radical SAM protein [Parvimonas parva]MBK1468952.1 radical SAM protein [Parvimonas parva]
MGLTIKWDSTYMCNLNCKHCINGDYLGDISNELNYEEFENIIKDIKSKYEIDYIHMLGGEPTVKKDFLKICKILDYNNIDFGFNTNGILLHEKLIKELLRLKHLKSIVFSIEGHNATINDDIRGKKVFNRIISSINSTNKNKDLLKSNINIEINFVISKKNYKYVSNMIDLCINLKATKLNILAMIEEGNAKGSGYSVSFPEQVFAMKEISKRYKSLGNKLIIDPKFTRPMAKNYMESVFGMVFPQSVHGCGAGLLFGFMDNKGRMFPCNRFKTNDLNLEKYSIRENKFKDVWSDEDFSVPFSIIESEEYRNLKPCKNCEYFSKTCFPCPLDVNKDTIITECSLYLNEIRKKNYNNIRPINQDIRFVHKIDSILAISTKTLNTIKLNKNSYNILLNIMNRFINDYPSLKQYSEKNNIEINDLLKFIDYLETKGFIEI